MSGPAYIPIFGDAYLADTQHLTLEEHGAYLKLLILAWRSPNCALPTDDRRIATMLGVGPKKWASLKPAVMPFWSPSEHGWQQKRLLKEYLWVGSKSKLNKAAAEARWNANSLQSNDTGNADAYADAHANEYAVEHANAMPLHLSKKEKKDSVANATDGKPSFDQPVELRAALFGSGVPYLVRHGLTDANARAMLGKWRKKYGDGAVIDALAAAQTEACSEPIPMINRILEVRNERPATRPTVQRNGTGDGLQSALARRVERLRDARQADADQTGGGDGDWLLDRSPRLLGSAA